MNPPEEKGIFKGDLLSPMGQGSYRDGARVDMSGQHSLEANVVSGDPDEEALNRKTGGIERGREEMGEKTVRFSNLCVNACIGR